MVTLVANSTLVFGMPWDTSMKWEFFAFQLFFLLGFAVRGHISSGHRKLRFNKATLFELEFILCLFFVMIVAANVYLGISTGFPIFSSNPSQAKVTYFTGGPGIVRRIDIGPYMFFCCGATLLAAIGHRRALAVTMIFIATLLVILGGGKGVLLPLIFDLAFVLSHKGIDLTAGFAKATRKYLLLILFLGTGIAVFITTKSEGGFAAGIQGFFVRLLYSGDVILYYFPKRDLVKGLIDPTIFGYLSRIFSEPLSMLRLMDYREPLGSVILGTGDNGFGPNPQYFIEADLYFGSLFGCVYSLLIGFGIASLRRLFFTKFTTSAVWFTVLFTMASYALALAVDSSLFVAVMFTVVIFLIPFWIIARLIRLAAQSKTGQTPEELRLALN
jgi:hypothetical protein